MKIARCYSVLANSLINFGFFDGDSPGTSHRVFVFSQSSHCCWKFPGTLISILLAMIPLFCFITLQNYLQVLEWSLFSEKIWDNKIISWWQMQWWKEFATATEESCFWKELGRSLLGSHDLASKPLQRGFNLNCWLVFVATNLLLTRSSHCTNTEESWAMPPAAHHFCWLDQRMWCGQQKRVTYHFTRWPKKDRNHINFIKSYQYP